jgi:GNAT superfamily N-acetyltransferase
MHPANEDYEISTEKGRLDVAFIHGQLAASYWASDRSRADVEESIRQSLCFGAYEKEGGRQVAFARVVTDGVTFSWLCDVVVDLEVRGQGLGKLLMESVVGHPDLGRTNITLATRDAHGLYEKYGFKRFEAMRLKSELNIFRP